MIHKTCENWKIKWNAYAAAAARVRRQPKTAKTKRNEMHAATPTATSVATLAARFNCKIYKTKENAKSL